MRRNHNNKFHQKSLQQKSDALDALCATGPGRCGKIWSAVLDLKEKPFNRKKEVAFFFFFIDTDGVGVSIHCQWK